MVLGATDGAGSQVLPWAALGAAVISVAGALLTFYATAYKATRDRRRSLYSEAFRAAMSWVEVVYRVRRRTPAGQEDLLQHLHKLQEDIAYYQGWLATEAPALGVSYRRLVNGVRTEVGPLLREAWAEKVRPPWEGTPQGEKEPDVAMVSAHYLEDVREHLSVWWWVRRRVRTRNLGPE
jgi:hypothetical protein